MTEVTVSASNAAEGAPGRVTIESGELRGRVESDVLAFKGIPYAAPPVGELRWRPPQPVESWSGVRDAGAYANDAMQLPFPSDAAPLGTEPAEDCLYLNVWRPADMAQAKLPVLVWIHGGGFVNGGSSPEVYAGDAFARQGIVFVSFNYRLGRFGFFAFPALTAERPDEAKGNYGYMDQIAALQWIQRNIAAFGGDPANVTVFGESAGGGSVHMLLTSPQGRGLFARAAIQSAGARDGERGPRPLSSDRPGFPSAETVGVNFARRWGVDGVDAAALAQLRALSAEQVTDGLNMATMRPADGPLTYGGPVLDGRIVVETPQSAYTAGRYAKVPLLIGANTADIGFSAAATLDEVLSPFDAKAAALAAYDPEASGKLGAIRSRVAMDRSMIEPSRFVARAFAAAGAPAWHFRFGYVADCMRPLWRFGAPHATEIPYVFDTVAAKYGASLTGRDAAVAHVANLYWSNFAKTGDPNGPGLPAWPRYEAASDMIMLFDADGVSLPTPDPWRARLNLTAAAAERAGAKSA
jgi:para-nitrobenzyl esterase